MELIVAVYEDWGIGKDGTQPVALSADRRFFRETTRGSAVIVGRKTVMDFPGQQPLPGRKNIVLTTQNMELPGFTVCHTPLEAMQAASGEGRAYVIGGGSIYRQLLPMCDRAYITKVYCKPESDTYFPDLDADPQWKKTEILQSGEENGIFYEMCLYERI